MSERVMKQPPCLSSSRRLELSRHPGSLHVAKRRSIRYDRSQPTWRRSIPTLTDDAETAFIEKAVIWMLVLALTPLILFHVITFFYPDIVMIPVAPN